MVDEVLAVGINARGAVTGGKQYEKSVGGMINATDKAGGSLKRFGKIATGIFAAIGGAMLIKKTISTITEFEVTMAELEGVTKATTSEMQTFNETARMLGATTRFSASQAAEGLLALSRAGFTVKESNDAIASTLTLATAAQLDLGRASEITSNTIRQFSMEAKDADKVADILVNTANKSNTTVEALAESLKFAGVQAGIFGISLEETNAALGALANVGVRGGMAGRGLAMVLSTLAGPTTEAKDTLKELGLTMEQVDPQKIGIIDAMEEFNRVNASAEQLTKIFGKSQLKTVLALMKSTKAMRDFTKSNQESQGTAKKNADLIENTLQGAFLELKSAIEEVMLMIGEAGFASAVKDAIKFTTALIRDLAGIKQKASAVTPAVAAMAEAIRKTYAAGKLIVALALPLIIGALTVKLYAATTAMIAFGVAVVNANIGLVTFAASIVGMVIPALTTMAKAMLTVLVPALGVFAAAYLGFKFGEWISQFAPVQKFMQKVIEGFVKGWEFFKKSVRSIWAISKSLFITLFIQPIQIVFRAFMNLMFKGIWNIAKAAKDALLGIPGMEDAYKGLANIMKATQGGFKMDLIRDTIVEDAKIIEDEYQAALRSIEDNTARVFAKIEAGPKAPVQSFGDMIREDMEKAVKAMDLFGADSKEAADELKRMQNHVALLRKEMKGTNTEGKEMLSIWGQAKNKVVEWGQTVVNWFQRLKENQDDVNTKSEQFQITLEDIGGSAAGTLTDLAMGATTFKEALADATDQIIRMAIQMAIMRAFSTPGVGGNPAAPVAGAKGLVAMASGGIVRGPTPALIGERGPEAVIPLKRDEKGVLGLESAGTTVNETTFNLVSPDSRGIKSMLLRDPKLIRQMNETYRQGYAID